jgi:hypothetical protein
MSPTPPIHPFYRTWFTTLDPLILASTIALCILAPAQFLALLVPPSLRAYDPVAHDPLIHQAAALYAFMGAMYAVLLRASNDRAVWRIVQGATLAADLALLAALYALLARQERLDVRKWKGVDWFSVVWPVVCAVTRGAFLVGVGEGKGGKGE